MQKTYKIANEEHMSAAVAQRLCICGKAVQGKATYCSAACKQRAYRAKGEPVTYPRYLTADWREQKCKRHVRVFDQFQIQFGGGGNLMSGAVGSGARPQFSPAMPAEWLPHECPDCDRETVERLEANWAKAAKEDIHSSRMGPHSEEWIRWRDE